MSIVAPPLSLNHHTQHSPAWSLHSQLSALSLRLHNIPPAGSHLRGSLSVYLPRLGKQNGVSLPRPVWLQAEHGCGRWREDGGKMTDCFCQARPLLLGSSSRSEQGCADFHLPPSTLPSLVVRPFPTDKQTDFLCQSFSHSKQ